MHFGIKPGVKTIPHICVYLFGKNLGLSNGSRYGFGVNFSERKKRGIAFVSYIIFETSKREHTERKRKFTEHVMRKLRKYCESISPGFSAGL